MTTQHYPVFTAKEQSRIYANRTVALPPDVTQTLQQRNKRFLNDPYFESSNLRLYAGRGVFGADKSTISLFDEHFLYNYLDYIDSKPCFKGRHGIGMHKLNDGTCFVFEWAIPSKIPALKHALYPKIYEADIIDVSLEGRLTVQLPIELERETPVKGNVEVVPSKKTFKGSYVELRRAA